MLSSWAPIQLCCASREGGRGNFCFRGGGFQGHVVCTDHQAPLEDLPVYCTDHTHKLELFPRAAGLWEQLHLPTRQGWKMRCPTYPPPAGRSCTEGAQGPQRAGYLMTATSCQSLLCVSLCGCKQGCYRRTKVMPELESARRCCRAPWAIQSPANASWVINELDITKPLWRSRARVFSCDGGVWKLELFLACESWRWRGIPVISICGHRDDADTDC